MKESNFVKVKICCIQNKDEAKMAIEFGASAIGLVSEMPSGPGPISNEKIKEIAQAVPPGVSSFLLTSKCDSKNIIDQLKILPVSTVQIVDRLEKGNHSDIKNVFPNISIVQVIHVYGEESIKDAVKVSRNVDAILLDSGNQKLKVKELGGTGRTHNWEISRKIREAISVPLFLAGGLNPDNVLQAIKTVRPYGVDVCSGVRDNGNLNEVKLKNFFEVVNAFNVLK